MRFERDRHISPLKAGKGSAYEGGVRVPMIVSWAGRSPDNPASPGGLPIAPGSVSARPVSSDDLLPTLVSAAGLAEAGEFSRGIDGVDLSPLLMGDDAAHANRAIYIHYPYQWYRDIGVGLGIQPFTAMRKERGS